MIRSGMLRGSIPSNHTALEAQEATWLICNSLPDLGLPNKEESSIAQLLELLPEAERLCRGFEETNGGWDGASKIQDTEEFLLRIMTLLSHLASQPASAKAIPLWNSYAANGAAESAVSSLSSATKSPFQPQSPLSQGSNLASKTELAKIKSKRKAAEMEANMQHLKDLLQMYSEDLCKYINGERNAKALLHSAKKKCKQMEAQLLAAQTQQAHTVAEAMLSSSTQLSAVQQELAAKTQACNKVKHAAKFFKEQLGLKEKQLLEALGDLEGVRHLLHDTLQQCQSGAADLARSQAQHASAAADMANSRTQHAQQLAQLQKQVQSSQDEAKAVREANAVLQARLHACQDDAKDARAALIAREESTDSSRAALQQQLATHSQRKNTSKQKEKQSRETAAQLRQDKARLEAVRQAQEKEIGKCHEVLKEKCELLAATRIALQQSNDTQQATDKERGHIRGLYAKLLRDHDVKQKHWAENERRMSCNITTQQQHFESIIHQLTKDLEIAMQQRDDAQYVGQEMRLKAELLQDKIASWKQPSQEDLDFANQGWDHMYATARDLEAQLHNSKRKTEIWEWEYALLSDGYEASLSSQSRQAEAEADRLLVQNLVSGIIQRVLDHRLVECAK